MSKPSPKRILLATLRMIALQQKSSRVGKDQEQDHSDADRALLDFINDPEVTEAFNEIEKWYA